RSGEAYFIVHIEHEAQNNNDFPQRMHLYFARLLERYGPPIYPIAVFSKRSRKPRSGHYQLSFQGLQILDFRYLILELAQLNWNDYLRTPSPVASALMSRMKVARRDRPRVKLQCLRMLATLKVDPAKSALISRFIDTYLQLTEAEVRIFNQDVENLPQKERQAVMRITTSWKEEGRQEGLHEGRQEGLHEGRQEGRHEGRQEGLDQLRLSLGLVLTARFGEKANSLVGRLSQLDFSELDRLLGQLHAGTDLEDLV
ncbi:hypothetical protein ABS71_08220, partial [bacterium SCN 62-11]